MLGENQVFDKPKCPQCDKIIDHAYVTSIDIKEDVLKGTTFEGVAYSCPHCRAVISLSIDPIAIKTSIINAVEDMFKKR